MPSFLDQVYALLISKHDVAPKLARIAIATKAVALQEDELVGAKPEHAALELVRWLERVACM